MPNNDYVKREDIFPAVTDIAKEIVFGGQDDDKVVDIINSIPAADVAPVIRCRDCKHAMMTYSGECKYCKMWMQDGIDDALYLDGDFYCAFAERKGENAEVR